MLEAQVFQNYVRETLYFISLYADLLYDLSCDRD